MLACQSQGDPSGAGWGEVETGRSGRVSVLSGDQAGTGEGLDAGEAWTLTPSVHNRLEEGPFTNTGDTGRGCGRGWRRQGGGWEENHDSVFSHAKSEVSRDIQRSQLGGWMVVRTRTEMKRCRLEAYFRVSLSRG